MDHDTDSTAMDHGRCDLPSVEVLSYSLPLRHGERFLGDLASGSEFRSVLSRERKKIRAEKEPPFGWRRTKEIDGEVLDAALRQDQHDAEAVVIERTLDAFSDRFADVLSRFLQTDEWRGTQRILCGGGLMEGEVGADLARRTCERIAREHPGIDLRRLHHNPDDAGMIGWAYAAPRGVLAEGNGFVAVDIGGTNVRWGIVRIDRSPHDRDRLDIVRRDKWCHAESDVGREEMLDLIAKGARSMLDGAQADGLRLAPFVGLSCPGVIRDDGSLASGGQNLPGDWSEPGFHLSDEIAERLKAVEGRAPLVLVHNDAVIQALSDVPRMGDVERWAAVTLGTGLGNCSFRNRGNA